MVGNAWLLYNNSQPHILFCACVDCHIAPAQQPIERLSSVCGPSPYASSLSVPAVSSVDLSDIPDSILGKLLFKHRMHDLLY